ncbi:50S ribosomal protein L32 [Rudaeicoccus suwonensis]|uniref:Large ribosomal subunit protein bL32 n=1 Tax=Rudaeicoccus suwonensis TaxID=657409 RepID=A0A561E7V8_9MICO|nr:50S ribosomal protein L32 [Rudaeicoccus suwonensis]TWE11705.1 LSU ribosomal protein L32P [Rudaeicoccus suwonensis]
MAVPKRKTSRSNTRHRRAAWKTTPIQLVPATTSSGEDVLVPRRLVRAVQRGLVDISGGSR